MQVRNYALVLSAVAMLTACNGFFRNTPTKVDARELGPHTALVTDSNTKMVFAFPNPVVAGQSVYCVEPSPDTAANVARTLEALAKANVTITAPAGQTSGGGGGELQGKGTTNITIQKLFERTQGIQAIRDTIFAACIATVNGFMTPEQYLATLNQALAQNGALMAAEVAASNGLSAVGNNEQQRLALVDFYNFIYGANYVSRPAGR